MFLFFGKTGNDSFKWEDSCGGCLQTLVITHTSWSYGWQEQKFSLSLFLSFFLSLLFVSPSISLFLSLSLSLFGAEPYFPTFSKSVSFQVWHLLLLDYFSMSHEKRHEWYEVRMTFFCVRNLEVNIESKWNIYIFSD